ncbi:MAG: aminotransferase class I/II-fold pyridoxal phosphate-dependent enzyme, partial [Thermoguttaceae bacterium]|nr:aminotransferase class I/II-fold pyridoxal phosphate-dependent enzyme [Thermoguttaceae bacterium]
MKKSNDLSRRDFLRAGAISAAAMSAVPAIADTADADTPAILGGPAARTTGAPGWPHWSSDYNAELEAVMARGVWSRAERVTEFEHRWAEMNGAKHCLAVVNGTNALSASFMELDINPGDEVICSPYTFSASVFGILYKGAMPVWADIDQETNQVDVEKLRAKITPRTKGIMVVHICGLPADMTAIMEIAREHNLFVVEDACQ